MINFIICDDEKEITEIEKKIITKIMFKTNIEYKIYIFNNYDKNFFNVVNSNIPNKIYLLDIEVNSKSGLDIAKKIRDKDWESILLILTSHYELENIAYKSKILLFDFISKFEIYDKKMTETITLCVNKLLNKDKLKIKSGKKLEQIEFNNILYLTYDSNIRKLRIITFDKTYEINETLKEISKKLKGNFVVTHRACIVNASNIKILDIKNRVITFNNNITTDLISKNYIRDVKQYAIN